MAIFKCSVKRCFLTRLNSFDDFVVLQKSISCSHQAFPVLGILLTHSEGNKTTLSWQIQQQYYLKNRYTLMKKNQLSMIRFDLTHCLIIVRQLGLLTSYITFVASQQLFFPFLWYHSKTFPFLNHHLHTVRHFKNSLGETCIEIFNYGDGKKN